MTLTCDEVNARLLDLVYGEGDAEERRALQAHADGCARCQADLAALGRTRATVRARLDDEPPVGVRARIMEAAAQALAGHGAPAASATAGAGAGAGAAGAPAAATAPPRPRIKDARGDGSSSFWARLRGRWTLPTFATVGAIAVMLLGSRVFLNPQRTYERGREVALPPASPSAASTGGESPAAEPSPYAGSAVAAAAPPAEKRSKSRDDDRDEALRGEDLRKERAPQRQRAAAHARPAVVAASPKGSIDELGGLGSLGGRVGGGARFASPPPPPPPVPAPASKSEASAYAGSDKQKVAKPATKKAARLDLHDEPLDRAARSARDTDDLEREGAAATVAGGVLESDRASAAGAAPAAQPPAAKPVGSKTVEKRRQVAPSESESADNKLEQAEESKPAGPRPEVEELTRRADRLFAEQRWDEAAAAYQELLRRYPTAAGVPRWRARVTESRRARLAAEPALAPVRPPAVRAPASAPAAAEQKK